MPRNPMAMASPGSAACNGSPPPPPSPHDLGGHQPVPPVAAEGNGTRADDQPITPSSTRDRFSSTLTSSRDLEAADHHHHQQAVRRSPIRGDTLLNLCVAAVLVLIIEMRPQQSSSATDTLSRALNISVVFFAFGFTFTWIGMFLQGVNAAAASVMEALGHLFTLFGFFFVMGTYLSQRFGGIIAWPLVAVLFLASASASASSFATFK